MGIPLLLGILFLCFFLLFIVIYFTIIYKSGDKKIAYILSFILFLIFLNFVFTNSINAFLYSKSDVKKDLKILKIDLKDDFKIVDNEIEGFPEYYQETKLVISERDKNKIIDKIKSAKNFIKYNSTALSQAEYQLMERENKIILNYQNNNSFFKSHLEKNSADGKDEIFLIVEKESDTLYYSIMK